MPLIRSSGPIAVLINAGRLDHLGPGRAWVELARSWAQAGVPVLRVDLSGLGDSPVRVGREPDVVYSPDAVDDISDIVRTVSPTGPGNVVLIGLCSGAYHVAVAGTTMRFRAVMMVNPGYPGNPGSSEEAPAPVPAKGTDRIRPAAAMKRRAQHLRVYPLLAKPARRFLDAKWWFVNRTGHGLRPALMLKSLVDGGVDTLVICRHYEGRLIQRGERGVLRRLGEKGGFRMHILAGTDHSLFLETSRAQVLPELTKYLLRLREN